MCNDYQLENKDSTVLVGCERNHGRNKCIAHKQDFNYFTKYDQRMLQSESHLVYLDETTTYDSSCSALGEEGSVVSLVNPEDGNKTLVEFKYDVSLGDDNLIIGEVDACLDTTSLEALDSNAIDPLVWEQTSYTTTPTFMNYENDILTEEGDCAVSDTGGTLNVIDTNDTVASFQFDVTIDDASDSINIDALSLCMENGLDFNNTDFDEGSYDPFFMTSAPTHVPTEAPTPYPTGAPTYTPTNAPTAEPRTCWLAKNPNTVTFLPQRTLIPYLPKKIGQIIDAQKDFTIKFTYHPVVLTTEYGNQRIVSFNKPELYDNVSSCSPCFWKQFGNQNYFFARMFFDDGIARSNIYVRGNNLVIGQDNEVKFSLINGVISFYVNGVLQEKTDVPSNYIFDGANALDVYSPYINQVTHTATYLQNVQYIPGGEV